MPQARAPAIRGIEARNKGFMRLLLIITDHVLLSFIRVVLADAGIEAQFTDQYTNAIEGSLAIFPRRVLVTADAWHRARRALTDAGLDNELATDTVQVEPGIAGLLRGTA